MQGTVNANRLHIAFFGERNAGKSSLVNAITSQEVSIVSPALGTTTDPVKKSMELLPLGPVLLIDTPGYDDEGELGTLRVKKTLSILEETDIAVLVLSAEKSPSQKDSEIINLIKEKNIPLVTVKNKCDLAANENQHEKNSGILRVSAVTGENLHALKEKIASLSKDISSSKKTFIGDMVHEGDIVLLVIPTDEASPKDRIILPQQMAVRSIIERNAMPYVCNVTTLPHALSSLKEKPSLVITDSQVFNEVNAILPQSIPLTSFSILMAEYKGTLKEQVKSAKKIDSLSDGDIVLVSEGCTHHRQCGDIGAVKLPLAIQKHSGKKLFFEFTSGGTFPKEPDGLKKYALVIHCGGCMLNEKEMLFRMTAAKKQGVPFTNYGMVLALCSGILERSLEALG